DSLLVLNGDDEYLRSVKDKPYRILYGGLTRGDYIARNLKVNEDSIEFTVNKNREIIHLEIPGKHNIQNGILCYIVAKELGIKDEELSHIKIMKSSMRMDLIRME